ncbi:MAG: hypothetical protein HYY01_08985 [Chloroflexi bacterium]|nr:hypothetical protein [Chloroflexota bacterium]
MPDRSGTVESGGTSSAGRDGLQAELAQVEAELEDLRELRRGFLGQTGVHIGYRVLRQVTSQLDSEEARLGKKLERLRGQLHEGGVGL